MKPEEFEVYVIPPQLYGGRHTLRRAFENPQYG